MNADKYNVLSKIVFLWIKIKMKTYALSSDLSLNTSNFPNAKSEFCKARFWELWRVFNQHPVASSNEFYCGLHCLILQLTEAAPRDSILCRSGDRNSSENRVCVLSNSGRTTWCRVPEGPQGKSEAFTQHEEGFTQPLPTGGTAGQGLHWPQGPLTRTTGNGHSTCRRCALVEASAIWVI